MIEWIAHASARKPGAEPTWIDELRPALSRLYAVGMSCRWQNVPIMRHLPDPRKMSITRKASVLYFSSGTTGAPKCIAYDTTEWDQEVANRAWCLAKAGLREGDRVAIALPFGPWFSGDNISQAAARLGTVVLPGGIYAPHQPGMANLFAHVRANALITTPTIALALKAAGLRNSFEKLITVGEAVAPKLADRLQAGYGVRPRMLYAASEGVIGAEAADAPGWFEWDSERVFLEVLPEGEAQPRQDGVGELLLTLRYRRLQPVVRYALGDKVELRDGRFRFLGRLGHAFTLATGVKVNRAQVERFLDSLNLPVLQAVFEVVHCSDGHDELHLALEVLHDGGADMTELRDKVAGRLATMDHEVQDAVRSGLLNISVELQAAVGNSGQDIRKRRLCFWEGPWKL